jgi:hypothetical protein
MEAVALSLESEKEHLRRLDCELVNRWKLIRTQMSEEGENPRKLEGSSKALPLPLDLAGLS